VTTVDRKQRLATDIQTHFRKFMLELEAMPPAMVSMGTIPGHVAGRELTGNELVAHALGWTELGITWCEQVVADEGKGMVTKPTEGGQWNTLDSLALRFYPRYGEHEFKSICEKLQKTQRQLVESICQLAQETLCRPVAAPELSLEQLLERHVVGLYASDLLRLRYWKKGLGWI